MRWTEFTVEGKGEFPFDMLRYDSCWPARPGDVLNLVDVSSDEHTPRKVTLRTYGAVRDERWASYKWPVLEARYL